MEIKLGSIQIFVLDINKAKKRYSKIIGMKLIEENKELKYLIMNLGGVYFCIETPNPKWGLGWNRAKIGGRSSIIFETKNIKKTVNELKKKGVAFVEEISRRPWGEYKAVFVDPDGNELNIVQTQQN